MTDEEVHGLLDDANVRLEALAELDMEGLWEASEQWGGPAARLTVSDLDTDAQVIRVLSNEMLSRSHAPEDMLRMHEQEAVRRLQVRRG